MKRSWTLRPGHGLGSLKLDERSSSHLTQGQVRIAVKALSLNARDLMVAGGQSPMPVADELIPLSDAAGVVEEVAEGVDRVAVGDRVVIAFNPAHQNGPFEPSMAPYALGEMCQGLLSSEVTINQMAVVKLPDEVSLEQAACLPCAGVTAWNALFEAGQLKPGQTALATGTGNVSLIALKLAKAAGARFGITSSDDAKLAHAQELGADFGINYRVQNDWDRGVREATGGTGAHVILETAGPPSVAAAVRAAAHGGRVAQIGFKAMEGPPVNMLDLALGSVSLLPIMVGSRAMLERVVAAVAATAIEIPIHARFAFEDAPSAFEAFMAGNSFGKTIIYAP